MKPYFAKYLPVEGEIKEGDLVANTASSGLEHRWIARWDIKNYAPTTKKVKLFLCSRDIKVGDKVLLGSHQSPDEAKPLHPDDFERGKHLGCYKVLGEISPEATWVKEGDEFEGSEVQQCYFYKTRYGYSKEHPWTENHERVTLFEIKGPCGHFH